MWHTKSDPVVYIHLYQRIHMETHYKEQWACVHLFLWKLQMIVCYCCLMWKFATRAVKQFLKRLWISKSQQLAACVCVSVCVCSIFVFPFSSMTFACVAFIIIMYFVIFCSIIVTAALWTNLVYLLYLFWQSNICSGFTISKSVDRCIWNKNHYSIVQWKLNKVNIRVSVLLYNWPVPFSFAQQRARNIRVIPALQEPAYIMNGWLTWCMPL